jgi:hypothetical protein
LRRTVAVAIVVVCAALLVAPRTAAYTTAISDGTGPLDTAADLADALHFEELIVDHLHYDQPHSQLYNTTERIRGDIQRTIGEGDAGLYTGAYLAAESYRYALARREIRKALLGSRVHAFWTAQAAEAKDLVDRITRKYHLLINIAKNWQTALAPTIGDHEKEPLDDGYFDFGGGLFPGEPGLLFRTCNPDDAPPPFNIHQNFPPNHPSLVQLRWDDEKTYDCIGATSRDQYAGATNGLTTALDLVGPYDASLRNMVANDLMAMSDYAIKYLFNQPRPHGDVVIPEVNGGNDLSNFISPLFVYTPIAQMNMVMVGLNAARAVGNASKLLKYNVVWADQIATELPQLQASMEIDASNPHDAYYKYHLNHLTFDNVIRHMAEPINRDRAKAGLAVMDATTGDDQNALFEAMTYSLTGERWRLDAAVRHHREWVDYRAHADAVFNIIDYRSRCGVDLECAPKDQVDILQKLPGGDELVIPFKPGTDPLLRALNPIPVGIRRPADFMWQKDPTIIVGCGGGNVGACEGSERWEGDGTDFLQTYWMIRYYSEVARPPLAPLPAWTGPRFR